MAKDYLKQGFSLVEILIALGILSIVLVGTMISVSSFTNISNRGRDAVKILEENRWALDSLVREAKYARTITPNAAGDTLTLSMINSGASGFDTITYYVQNGVLYRRNSANVVTAVTNSQNATIKTPLLPDKTFKSQGTDGVMIAMEFITGNTPKQQQTQILRTTIFPMNSRVSAP